MSLVHGFYRQVPNEPAGPEEIERRSRQAWHEKGVALLSPADDRLTWDQRETIRQAAEKLYGKREGKRA